MTELDAEDSKLVVLARGAMGRAERLQWRRGPRCRRPHLRFAPVKLRALRVDRVAGGGRRRGVQRCDRTGGRRYWRLHR